LACPGDLYAGDLDVIAEDENKLIMMLNQCKSCFQGKGWKVNVSKTKVIVSDGVCNEIVVSSKYPCSVCGKGVDSNSIMCNGCEKWVHKKCSSIKSSLMAASGKFICKCCHLLLQRGILRDGSEIEVVEKFC